MKSVMAKVAGKAEGKVVSEIVKQKLSKLAS
jgi:Glu-tRNA(Gln) amidotransferase subunit E-like FAD-binding protein